MGSTFSLESVLSPSAFRYHQKMQITSARAVYLHLIFPLLAFFLLLCISSENGTKLEKFEPQTKVERKLANIQTAFDILSTLVLRNHSKWRADKTKHGEGDDVHLNFRSKRNK